MTSANSMHRQYFRPEWLDTVLPQALCAGHAAQLYRDLLACYQSPGLVDESHPFVSTSVNSYDVVARPAGELPHWLYPDEDRIRSDDCPECWLANAQIRPGDPVWTHCSGWQSLGITCPGSLEAVEAELPDPD